MRARSLRKRVSIGLTRPSARTGIMPNSCRCIPSAGSPCGVAAKASQATAGATTKAGKEALEVVHCADPLAQEADQAQAEMERHAERPPSRRRGRASSQPGLLDHLQDRAAVARQEARLVKGFAAGSAAARSCGCGSRGLRRCCLVEQPDAAGKVLGDLRAGVDRVRELKQLDRVGLVFPLAAAGRLEFLTVQPRPSGRHPISTAETKIRPQSIRPCPSS